ncbi:engulfment and cell motility protein 2-like isoform X2 [Dreissena polymorpha]|nr:engulfment and cell motility protein 2-like isoform X2 [Dreissena polymorpha]XP_052231192.1 engulfment and cell motility protein 2-like isoform X2 [Dreissena polymorpha]
MANNRASTGSRGHSENMKKVAVTMPGQQALFLELDQNRPLTGIVQDICDKWNLPNPDDFALQFSEKEAYITERNRADISNGNVLMLTDSSARSAQIIIDKLNKGSREDKIEALRVLSHKCVDQTFAKEFIDKGGLKMVVTHVSNSSKNFSGDPLMYLLKSFIALMDHGMIPWDLENEFIKEVASCVSGDKKVNDGIVRPALEILENVFMQCTDQSKVEAVDSFITTDKVIEHLTSSNNEVQQSALALINAMFMKSSPENKKKLSAAIQSKGFRANITKILEAPTGHDMAHELYRLQKLILNMYEDKMRTPVVHSNQTQVELVKKTIEELRRIAFDFSDPSDQSSSSAARKPDVNKDWKKLGFMNLTDPYRDFEHAPPGLLALENMIYFAQMHKETYIKVVLENCGRAPDQDCPFIQAAIKLTSILCDLLKIGELPNEDESSYYPMFFTTDKPLEEFFSTCINLVNRTWKEMRASKEDFEKVLSVVKEQITRALDRNQMPRTFEMFKQKLVVLAYPELRKIWEAERQKREESKAQAKPILELRAMLKPEIMDLIRRQRLTYLEGGTRFHKYDEKGNKVKNRYQYWRLAANHKAFSYGDCSDMESPALEELQHKVAIQEIKGLVTGADCAKLLKNAKIKLDQMLPFALVLEASRPDEEKFFFFNASSDQEAMIWEDGINALLNEPMRSKQTRDDSDVLLNMEIKLRLLETEGITIPNEPPPIPPLPDNFNFAYTMAV